MRAAQLMFVSLLFAGVTAFAQTDLPAKMKGQWRSGTSGRTGDAIVETVKQESPDKARVRVNFTNQATAHGFPCGSSAVEADAQRTDGAWKFSFPSRYCQSNWTVTIKPVEGKQRFEGDYTNDFPTSGSVYFEW